MIIRNRVLVEWFEDSTTSSAYNIEEVKNYLRNEFGFYDRFTIIEYSEQNPPVDEYDPEESINII